MPRFVFFSECQPPICDTLCGVFTGFIFTGNGGFVCCIDFLVCREESGFFFHFLLLPLHLAESFFGKRLWM